MPRASSVRPYLYHLRQAACDVPSDISEGKGSGYTLYELNSESYLESHGIRNGDREVGKYREKLICLDTLECQVMRDLMDGEEEIMVRSRSDNVRRQDEDRGQRVRIPKQESSCQLDGDNEQDDPFRERLIAHQLGDLRAEFSWVARVFVAAENQRRASG